MLIRSSNLNCFGRGYGDVYSQIVIITGRRRGRSLDLDRAFIQVGTTQLGYKRVDC